MAMASGRQYGNMSIIRCTNCSAEIDILRAQDHVCEPASSAMQPMDRINNAYSSMRANNNIPHPFQPRPPPTMIDPAVANRPFLSSPLSPNGGQRTPTGDQRSPFRMPSRSATSPYPPPPRRSPSPELPLAQECAFPPFPLPESRTSSPKPPRKAPERSETDPTPHTLGLPPGLRSTEKEDQRSTRSTRSVSRPLSQRSRSSSLHRPTTAGSDYGRKSSFSSTRSRPDGFFESDPVPPVPFFGERQATQSPAPHEAPRLPFVESPSEEREIDRQGPLSFGDQHGPASSQPLRSLGHFRKPSMSAATRPLHEIGSTKTHRPTLSRGASPAMLDVDFGQPRSASATSNRSDVRLFDAPPVPEASHAHIEEAGNPYRQRNYEWPQRKDMDTLGLPSNHNAHGQDAEMPSHTPTDSVSSDASAVQTHSSRSSPPTSALSFDPIKNPYAPGGSKYPGAQSYNPTLNQDYGAASPPQSPHAPTSAEGDTPASLSPRRNQNQFPPRGQSRNPPPVHMQPPQSPQYPPSESQQPRLPPIDSQDPQFPPPDSRQPQLPPLDSWGSQSPPLESRQPKLPPLDVDQSVVPPQAEQGQPGPGGDLPPPHRGPGKSFSRPNYSRPAGLVEPESPMDPAMQGNKLTPLDTQADYPPPQLRYQQSAPQSPQSAPPTRNGNDYLDPPRSPMSAPAVQQGGFLPPPRSPANTPPPRGSSRTPPAPSSAFPSGPRPPLPGQPIRRATTGTKGNCRGCGEGIKGKSVSSADGRLTGRWHKQCFVCKTCQQPFPGSDFYVFGNQPYCARHYHQLNKTICVNCDRGIEGQYVETDRHIKFHTHCFTCKECHLILRDNYYEDPQSGKVLCEQHAFNGPPSRFGGPGGRRFPERRTTRLMMMT